MAAPVPGLSGWAMAKDSGQSVGRRVRHAFAAACLLAIICGAFPVRADQTITLKAHWNLISLSVAPANDDPAAVFAPLIAARRFQSAWTYDAAGGVWSSYPKYPEVPAIEAIRPGRGYWVQVSGETSLTVQEPPNALPPGMPTLEPGWNLIGVTGNDSVRYDDFFGELPVGQLWRHDAVAGFEGFALPLPANGTPPFTDLEPGRGYWVELKGAATGPLVAAVTTAAGAGATQPRGRLQYALDSVTFDVDRPPLGGGVEDEDTSEFSAQLDPATQTNQLNPQWQTDASLDGPVGDPGAHRHAFVALGGPVIGTSAGVIPVTRQGITADEKVSLSIGADP